MRRSIVNHTTRGELVYEPFLGSGTTLAAAEQSGRVCCGLELDPKYVDVVIERWQNLTGKQAVLDGQGTTFEEVQVQRKVRAAECVTKHSNSATEIEDAEVRVAEMERTGESETGGVSNC